MKKGICRRRKEAEAGYIDINVVRVPNGTNVSSGTREEFGIFGFYSLNEWRALILVLHHLIQKLAFACAVSASLGLRKG